jgi:hypothetical protein
VIYLTFCFTNEDGCKAKQIFTTFRTVWYKYSTINHSLTHEAERFLKSHQFCSYSRTSQYFIASRRFITVLTRALHWSPNLHQINPIHTIPVYLSKINFNIVHPPPSCSSQWPLSFWLSRQYPICIPLRTHSCCMPCPSHLP